MKVTWEEADIIPGQRYAQDAEREVWIIGFLVQTTGPNLTTSTSLSDGMVLTHKSKADLARILTENNSQPVELFTGRKT